MNLYKLYRQLINEKIITKRAMDQEPVEVKNLIFLWLKEQKSSKKIPLNEIFVVEKSANLKLDLINFLKHEFKHGNLSTKHDGISTVEYKPEDWFDAMADVIINNLLKYFETLRGQTERNSSPIRNG